MSSDLLNEIANIKAVVNKTWDSHQKYQQRKDKEGGNKKKGDGGKTNKQTSGNRGNCCGCGGSGHYIRDCPSSKKSLNSAGGGKEDQGPPQNKKKEASRATEEQDQEEEATPEDGQEQDLNQKQQLILIVFPYDAIVDIGSSLSLIDVELCESLCLKVNSFTHDIAHYVGIEGTSIVGSALSILGWVEVELSNPHMGFVLVRFRITECQYDRAIPIVLGSHQVKRIFSQANLNRKDFWPKPWKSMYEWCSLSKWYESESSDDSSDFVDLEEEGPLPGGFQLAKRVNSPVSSLSDSWSDIMAEIELNLDEDLNRIDRAGQEEKNRFLGVTKGVPDSGLESEGEACSAPSAMAGPLQRKRRPTHKVVMV